MNTPICDFVKKYVDKKMLRFHMPGHKGKSFLGLERLDITEIEGADVLYGAEGIIKESQANAASLFGTAKTLYSTEGSSLSIRAMLYLTSIHAKSKGEKPLILAARNVHKAFISAAALVDFEVDWLFPEANEGLLSCKITPERLREFLNQSAKKPSALYITSPDYLGNISDISGLSTVCKEFGVLLLVDNAHGAYLNFTEKNQHPISLGADMCCDSAHKTLPVLTGGGYLHISKTAPELLAHQAEFAMALFASTSPSYIIMQSLDMANKYMAEGYSQRLKDFCAKAARIKDILCSNGYTLIGDEALKITVYAKDYGYFGTELAEVLSDKNIICEFADADFLVLMLTPEISDAELQSLKNALVSIERRKAVHTPTPPFITPTMAKSIREAIFSTSEEISTKDALGCILANYAISCPPAVPIAICGEVIDENIIKCFDYYGIEKCKVVK